ncbi:hypothetical protein CEXT_775391 [Caerostris extrusa]|uniref:Uncharacterized protein n=1 Tax=Caerostris extrusa TaxID=172846 RepID=A0AAV4ML81_CAEEX|nr:hypothetical protein CEXT_775391 [Caerostris extrusa]
MRRMIGRRGSFVSMLAKAEEVPFWFWFRFLSCYRVGKGHPMRNQTWIDGRSSQLTSGAGFLFIHGYSASTSTLTPTSYIPWVTSEDKGIGQMIGRGRIFVLMLARGEEVLLVLVPLFFLDIGVGKGYWASDEESDIDRWPQFSVDLRGSIFIYSWLLCFYIYFNSDSYPPVADFRGLRNRADDRKRENLRLDSGESGGGDGFLFGSGSAFLLDIGVGKGHPMRNQTLIDGRSSQLTSGAGFLFNHFYSASTSTLTSTPSCHGRLPGIKGGQMIGRGEFWAVYW